MSEISRRELLQLLGVSASTIALGGCNSSWVIPEQRIEEALRGPGTETFKNTVCQLCPAGCGIRVRLVDGIPVHIDGNPVHPINRGGICSQGAAGLDYLYHPDRIQQPLARIGKRGQSRWRAISWTEAIDRLSDRLTHLRETGTPEQLGLMISEKQGLMYELFSRFMQKFGSGNIIVLDEHQNESLPFDLLFGWSGLPEYDVQNAQLVLSFGANFLEEGASPVHSIWAYNQMRDGNGLGRGRLVYIDSRHSLTAASADRFVLIKPGTHGAVALGVAYVLIKERYYDPLFVDEYVDHFESWIDEQGVQHAGFQEFVLSNYYPEKVAAISGVSAETIVEIAREFGQTRPSLAMVSQMGSAGTNGLFNTLAALSLNVLQGNVEKIGGLRMRREAPFAHLPAIAQDEVAVAAPNVSPIDEDTLDLFPLRNDSVFNACQNLLSDEPRHLDTLMIYGSNPAFDHPYAKRIRQVLNDIPFIVSFATILDESSEYADLVLPEHAYLERWMDSGSRPGIGFANASVSQPVIEPLYQTKHTGDVLIELESKVLPNTESAIPHPDYLAALKSRFRGVFAAGEGTVISGSFEESWMQFLKERGWQNLVYETFDDFWNLLVEQGGWWDPLSEELPPNVAISTENGKIPLFLSRLVNRLKQVRDQAETPSSINQIFSRWGISDRSDGAFFPHYEPPRLSGSPAEYPYVLLSFGVPSNRRGLGGFSPMLQEMFGYYRRLFWSSWVELNPETAHAHHLQDGDIVRVRSEHGSISAPAVINEALEPHCIAVPFGMGHTSFGRFAKGIGVNPYELLAPETDHVFGKPATLATRVHIEKKT